MHVLLFETIALVGATVHTMEPGPEPGGVVEARVATVLVEDGRITAVGPDLEVPDGARVVELDGLHLVPGLIDAYATFDADHDPLWLAAGVTAVRDAGSSIGEMFKEKNVSMRDRGPGPSLLVSSPVFAAPGTARPDAFLLGGPEAAAEQIAEFRELLDEADAGVEYYQFDRAIDLGRHRVVCKTALDAGLEAWGPLPIGMSIVAAQANGQTSLIGLDSLPPQGQRFETLEDLSVLDDTVAELIAGNWRVAPLLMGTARILRGAQLTEEPDALGLLGREYEVAWRADLEAFAILKAGKALGPVELSLDRQRDIARKLHAAGVQLVPGSGAPSGGIAPGSGLVDELEEWTRAGVTPAEALALATVGAARAVGEADERGRIAPGLVADLVALASDPRRSVAALRAPELVVLRGRTIESFEQTEGVDRLRERVAAMRAERMQPIQLDRPPMPPGAVVAEGQAEVVAYGERTAVERYAVVRVADGRLAYGARIRIPQTPTSATREMVLVQFVREGLVDEFDLTLDELDEDGAPRLGEKDAHAFYARGRAVGDTKKLAVERFRFGVSIGSQRAEEAIAVIDGSIVVVGLVAAMHFPVGGSYLLGFEQLVMEPVVDRLQLAVDPDDGRLELTSARGGRVYGLGEGGEVLFAARAAGGGRLDVVPDPDAVPDAARALGIPDARRFTGDPERWAERGGGEDK
ncbi:MAG: amidohydrolase family protein [Planctomycetota bacterium]